MADSQEEGGFSDEDYARRCIATGRYADMVGPAAAEAYFESLDETARFCREVLAKYTLPSPQAAARARRMSRRVVATETSWEDL